MQIEELKEIFRMNDQEMKKIEECVAFYAQKPSLSRLTDVVARAFAPSLWELAKKLFMLKAVQILPVILRYQMAADRLSLKADAVSEFMLRYLVTKEALRLKTDQWWIRREHWKKIHQYTDDLPIEEMIIRSARGCGFEMPEYTFNDVQRLLNSDGELLLREIEEIEKLELSKSANIPQELQENRRYWEAVPLRRWRADLRGFDVLFVLEQMRIRKRISRLKELKLSLVRASL